MAEQLVSSIETFARPLLPADHELLRTKLEPFNPEKFGTQELIDTVRALCDSLEADEGLVGLAANQIGIEDRMVAVVLGWANDAVEDHVQVMINPNILWVSEETEINLELCGSVPGVMAMMKNPKQLKVEFFDEEGNRHTLLTNQSRDAQLIFHELKHLEGVRIPDAIGTEDLVHIATVDSALGEEASKKAFKEDSSVYEEDHKFDSGDRDEMYGLKQAA